MSGFGRRLQLAVSGLSTGYGSDGWSDAVLPWQLQPGESVDDNRPGGVSVVNYDDYSNGGALSFGQTLSAIRAAASAPYYVRLGPGTYHITDFSIAAGNGTGKGYQDVNSTKYWAGCIGAGAAQTFVVVDPGVMSSAQLSGVSSGTPTPVQMFALYAGSPGLPVPTFFSGITFRGSFQQTISLSGLSGSAPAPYAGLNLSSTQSGSMVQYCRFQGFGFDAKSSPPYELGSIQSGHSNWTLRRSEVDGRIAAEIDNTQPVSAGGVMWNYENNVQAVDSWLHHTRRSGFATHDPAPSEGGNGNSVGVYYCENFQVENIANTTDGYAGSSLGFAVSNVEEVRQSFTYVRPRFTSTSQASYYHIVIATSNGNSIANGITVTDPIIGDSTHNGCLVVRFVKTPNSDGTDPYYTLYQSGGLSALPLTVTNHGTTLTPVLLSSFDATTNTPANSYLVTLS